MAIQTRRQSLTQARLLFNQQGAVPGGMVAEPILRSWRRCADLGFDMRGLRPAEPLTQAELREARERNEALRRMSDPVMAELRKRAHGQGGLVILSDSRGLVLDCGGDLDFAQRASRIALMPGSPWDEAAAGTNAIGTALVEGRSIVVHGAEHYFEPNRILTCAAVPVCDSQGRILGVLDLSSQAGGIRPDALALVRAAVDQIEHRLFAQAHERDTVLRLHADPAGLGAPGEALLAFRGDLLVGANRLALRALELSATALGVYRHEDLFEDALTHAPDATGRVQARNGAVYHARLSLPPSPAPRVVPAPERSQPRAVAPAPAAVSLDAAALDALGRSVHLMDAGVSILLQGETGAGKEVFARQMHARSRRAAGPFVAVNCAALPESLIESELFGYEDGAFTGARRQGSKGLLRQAHGGVLFLDEIGDMPLALQSRLLRVLQEREVSPLGGARPVPVDFALLCATHRPLAHEGADAPVRPDLYFRIAEYTVTLGPLRGGRTCASCCARSGTRRARRRRCRPWSSGRWPATPGRAITGSWSRCCARCACWPARRAWRACRCCRRRSSAGALMRRGMRRASPEASPPSLQALADAAIREALAAHGGNVSRAARVLGVHRSTLYRRVAALEAARAERP